MQAWEERLMVKQEGIKEGEIIIPGSAHFSFKKAADMMNLKIIEAKLDENYKIDVDSVKENISDNTVAIVAIAGTTELGLVDPIEELSEIAYENNIYFHVDAAFGGFSIPFLRKIGYAEDSLYVEKVKLIQKRLENDI